MNNRDNKDAYQTGVAHIMLQQKLGELIKFLETQKPGKETGYFNEVPGLKDEEREKIILDVKDGMHKRGKRGTLLSQSSIVELDKKVRAVEALKNYENFLEPEMREPKHKL